MLSDGGHYELPGEDEHLLRGEGDIFPRRDGGECGLQTGRSYDGHEHQIGFGESGDFRQAREPTMQLRTDGKQIGLGGAAEGGVVKDSDVRDVEIASDLREALKIATRCNSDQLQFVAVRSNDAERGFADGTCGAQEDNALGRS